MLKVIVEENFKEEKIDLEGDYEVNFDFIKRLIVFIVKNWGYKKSEC